MRKRKYVIIFIILFVLAVVLFKNTTEDNIRLRVIANSNSPYDIKVKKEVMNILTNCINVSDTEEDIKRKLPIVNDKLNKYQETNNVIIKVEYGLTDFPTKSLDGKIVSGGKFVTLLVTIGEGNGNNYWTILYPEYFGITFEDIYSGEVEIRSYFYDKVIRK